MQNCIILNKYNILTFIYNLHINRTRKHIVQLRNIIILISDLIENYLIFKNKLCCNTFNFMIFLPTKMHYFVSYLYRDPTKIYGRLSDLSQYKA